MAAFGTKGVYAGAQQCGDQTLDFRLTAKQMFGVHDQQHIKLSVGGAAQKLLHTGTQGKRSGFGTGLGKHGLAAIPAQPARRAQT